jgi:hypothetical protein
MRCAIAFAHYSVGMNLRLTAFQGNVADQRKQVHLLIQRNGRFILFRFPVEPSELHGRKRAYGFEAC